MQCKTKYFTSTLKELEIVRTADLASGTHRQNVPLKIKVR